MALIEHLKAATTPWGLTGQDADIAEERAAAITAIPAGAARAIFEEPDPERREALIRAVVAAHRAGGVRAAEPEEEYRQCAAADCTTGPYGTHGSYPVRASRPRQRYCSDACRKRDQQR